MGAFLFNDAPMRTLMANRLSEENVKGLYDVRARSAIPARYADAIFPAQIPRIFTMNWGPGNDAGFFWDTYGHRSVANFVRRNQVAVHGHSSDERATFSRMVVFIPSREELGFVNAVLAQHGAASYAEELARQQAYFDELDGV